MSAEDLARVGAECRRSRCRGLRVIDEALTHEPRNALLHAWRGLLLHALRRYDEEIVELRHAVSLDDRPAVWMENGKVAKVTLQPLVTAVKGSSSASASRQQIGTVEHAVDSSGDAIPGRTRNMT